MASRAELEKIQAELSRLVNRLVDLHEISLAAELLPVLNNVGRKISGKQLAARRKRK